MNAALIDLDPAARSKLTALLETEMLAPPYSASALRAELGAFPALDDVARALNEMERLGVRGRACAAVLRAVEAASARMPTPDLVWSGPPVRGLHALSTRGVYEQLVSEASHSILASSFTYYDGKRAFELLAARMDAAPSLEVTLLLNIQRRYGDGTPADELVRRFTDRLWKSEWPGKRRPRVYYDPRALDPGNAAVLHAKAFVSDERDVFITSANLTESAFDRNYELGVRVRDAALARAVASHFRALIELRLLLPLPSE